MPKGNWIRKKRQRFKRLKERYQPYMAKTADDFSNKKPKEQPPEPALLEES